MAPGFILFLAGLLLAASAPLILVAVLGCLFVASTAWVARSALLGGLFGALLGGLWWLLANVYAVPPGYFSGPAGATICAAGFSLGGMVGSVVSAASRRSLGKLRLVLVAFVLGNALALLSVLIERKGPELLPYGNMCGANSNEACYEPALNGGFPLAYLTDMPGVSVQHQLSFGEDTLHPAALVLDIAFYIAAILIVGRLASRISRLTGRPTRQPTGAPDL
jgi:hypothetical protein